MSLTCMKIIDPTTGWFKIFKVPCFDPDKVSRGNSEYMEKYATRVIPMFNQTQLFRYPCKRKVVFDNRVNFKRYFTQFLKDSSITPICIFIKNPQSITLVERINQVIYNMFVTKDIDSIAYDYLYPWGGGYRLIYVVDNNILSSHPRFHTWSGHVWNRYVIQPRFNHLLAHCNHQNKWQVDIYNVR